MILSEAAIKSTRECDTMLYRILHVYGSLSRHVSAMLQKTIWSTTGNWSDHSLHVVTAAVLLLHCLTLLDFSICPCSCACVPYPVCRD